MPRTQQTTLRKSEARRLLRLREASGLTQSELAEVFRVTQNAVAQWESGVRTLPGPALAVLELYEQHLGLEEARPIEPRSGLRMPRSLSNARALALWTVIRGAASLAPSPIARHAQAAASRQFAKTVGGLRGLSMKLAQMAVHLDFVVGKEQRVLVGSLQEAPAPPMPPAALLETFLGEFGRLPRELFAEWSAEPMAVASIGQVHRAVTKGGVRVAVKVRHPRIVEMLKDDLAQMKALERVTALVAPAQKRGVIYEELRERLLEECDYRVEAEQTRRFAERYGARPGMELPRVLPEYSGEKVLTTTLIEGRSFEEFERQASQADRDRAGTAILAFFCESFIRDGSFHADAHPSNLVFSERGVGFLDFGRVKTLAPTTLRVCRRNARALLERDPATVRRGLLELGCAPSPDDFDFFYAYRLLLQLHRPFLVEGPVEMSADLVTKAWKMMTTENVNRTRTSYPPDFVFMGQFFFGTMALNARLRARVNFRDVLLPLLYDEGEARPAAMTKAELLMLGL